MIVETESLDRGGSEDCPAGGGDGQGGSGPIKASRISFGETDCCDEDTSVSLALLCKFGSGRERGLRDSGYPEDSEAGAGATDSDLLLLEPAASAGVVSSNLSRGRPRALRRSSGSWNRSPQTNSWFDTSPAAKIPGRPGLVEGGGSSTGQNLYTHPEG